MKKYLIFCCVVSIFVLVFKPIYSGNYAGLSSTFAPIHVTVATYSPCENYALSVSVNKRALSFEIKSDDVRFYPLSFEARPYICALARNAINAPIKKASLRMQSQNAIEDIEFISITIGSENFYIAKEQILEMIEDLSDSKVLDLSHYKLKDSDLIMNSYTSLVFGFLYYFLTPPYMFIWVFCIVLALFMREQFPSKKEISPLLLLAFIIILGVVLRVNNYNSFSLWGDELYSVGVVSYPNSEFSSVFLDPGNPPFYNLLLKIWLHIFGYTSAAARSLSVLIGSLGTYSMYLLLKNHALTLKTKGWMSASSITPDSLAPSHLIIPPTSIALIGAFFFACSYVAIGASHEVRGYVLVLSVIPLVFYFLLNLYKSLSWRNILGYIISASILCNTHYFGSIVVFASFIVSVIMLWGEHKKMLAIFVCDVLIACSLLPFFIITAFSRALSDTSFNTWIPYPSLDTLFLTLPVSLGSASGAFIFLLLFLLIPKSRNAFLWVCAMMIILCITLPFLLSFIRPIYVPKYAIYIIYPFMLCVLSIGIVLLAQSIMPTRAQVMGFITLSASMILVALTNHTIQPIGIGDNSRAKFQFITQDSRNENNAYIVDTNMIMAKKQRQYEIYGFTPNAQFLRIETKSLLERLSAFKQGDVLYLDEYYTHQQDILNQCRKLGARVYVIPFGILAHDNMEESQEVVYKVVF